ncbi:MAG: hypothetical protein Q9227_001903 [Pyrenula ochraceoflavens]
MTPPITEGQVNFQHPNNGEIYHTWYKIFGSLDNPSSTPLIILHGGPGACHDYLLPLSDLATSHAVPVIFYDQLGNGRSTHLPDKNGDESFWTVSLFLAELDNLLSHLNLRNRPIDLYGHSWGGMLAAEWAASHASPPANLRRLVISNSLASMDGWRQGIQRLRDKLPEDVRQVLDRCEAANDFASPEYEAAVEVFYKRHLSLARPWPCKEVQAALEWFAKDPTTYGTIVPTLLINGSEDEAQDEAMQPFFELIPKVKWVELDNAAHFSHVDQKAKYLKHLTSFITPS